MNKEELRIGNIVQVDYDYYIVNSISATLCECLTMENNDPHQVHIGNIDPIPLSHAVLEKCGFEYTGFKSYDLKLPKTISCAQKVLSFSGDYLYLYEWKNAKCSREDDIVTIWNKDIMKTFYLHSLQNVYFNLCGQELQITL